jgi:hypothetical protein
MTCDKKKKVFSMASVHSILRGPLEAMQKHDPSIPLYLDVEETYWWRKKFEIKPFFEPIRQVFTTSCDS